MKRIHKLLLLLLLLIVIFYIYSPRKPYPANSNIHNTGLFTPQDYKKGDIIIENVFPGKDDDEVLFNPISRDLFKKYISYEGTLINHCSVNYNSDIKSNGNKIYTVIAIKDIPKDTEIVVNYDVLHKKYPFIAGSKEGYKLC